MCEGAAIPDTQVVHCQICSVMFSITADRLQRNSANGVVDVYEVYEKYAVKNRVSKGFFSL